MLAEKISQAISSGATGGTYSVSGREMTFKFGYLVGISGIRTKGTPTEEEIRKISAIQEPYIGFWKDGDEICLDAVRWVSQLDRAEKLGRAKKQIAIWDCKAGLEIYL